MMRAALLTAAAAALAACTGQPRAHTEAEWAACEASGQPSALFVDGGAACSAVIADLDAEPTRRAVALVRRGALRAQMGQLSRAVADFGRALRLDPNAADALVQRGMVHANRGAYDIAVRDFDAALAIAPWHELAASEREFALNQRGDAFTSQVALITQALQRNPTDPGLLNERCWLRATAGRELELALADCDVALVAQPNFAAALDSRGLVQLKRGAFAQALADYEAALALEPGTAHYLYGRGVARRALGQTAEAESDFAAALAADPTVAQLYASYGI